MSDKEDKIEHVKKCIHAMRLSEEEDEKIAGFVWAVFGHESKFTMKEFLEKVQKKECSWIFNGK